MKRYLNSFVIAFSMYSRVPMPKGNWTKENMRYVMCFFPLIGGIVGGAVFLWLSFCNAFSVGVILRSVGATVIPLLLTGGIHMDGFLDTVDALSSYKTKEEKLEILKDPHTGAFAVLGGVVYLLLSFGMWSEVPKESYPVLCLGFVISRAFSGLSVASFPMAKDTGLVRTFSDSAHKSVVRKTMFLYLIVVGVTMVAVQPIYGGVSLFSSLLVFSYYWSISKKKFGGITGDLAGYFLQICELCMVILVVFISLILRTMV